MRRKPIMGFTNKIRSKFLYFYFVSTFSVFNRGDGRYVQS